MDGCGKLSEFGREHMQELNNNTEYELTFPQTDEQNYKAPFN